jgi:hypothetical protein
MQAQNPNEYVYKITKGKFETYLKNYTFDVPFIVAGTIVCVKDNILLKAKNEEDAKIKHGQLQFVYFKVIKIIEYFLDICEHKMLYQNLRFFCFTYLFFKENVKTPAVLF